MLSTVLVVRYSNIIAAMFTAALIARYRYIIGITMFSAVLVVCYCNIIAAMFTAALIVCYCDSLLYFKGKGYGTVFRCCVFRRIGRVIRTARSLIEERRNIKIGVFFFVAVFDIIEQRCKISLFILAVVFVKQVRQAGVFIIVFVAAVIVFIREQITQAGIIVITVACCVIRFCRSQLFFIGDKHHHIAVNHIKAVLIDTGMVLRSFEIDKGVLAVAGFQITA